MNTEKIKEGLKGSVTGVRNLAYWHLNKPLTPRWLVFMLTDTCNSRCTHCNIWQGPFTKDILTTDEIRKILSDPLFKNIEYVNNTGGEISTRNDLLEVLKIEHEMMPDAILMVSTNGLLPDRVVSTIEEMLKIGARMEVGTSMDGIGEEHDKLRGVPGNFEKTVNMIHKLQDLRNKYGRRNLELRMQITISPHNLHSLEAVRNFAEDLDVDLVEGWYNESGFYGNSGKGKLVDIETMKAVQSQDDTLLKEKWLKMLKGESIKFPCFGLNTFLVIKCQGDVVPCLTKWNDTAGNLRENSLTEIWSTDKMRMMRENVKQCDGCLNSWGTGWSFASSVWPFIGFYLRHPKKMVSLLRGGN